jgi:hypothetical protein
MGFLNALTLIFVLAKLFDKIDWSWWLVFAPSYISLVILIFVLVSAGLVAWFTADK